MISNIKKIFNFNTDNKFRTINLLEDEEEVKKIINMNNMGINIFDDEKKEVLKNISIDKRLFELAKKFYHTNLEVAYKIFDLVLENTKNVDMECYKIKTTPLIYATELNETELVKKLLKKRCK